MTDTFASRLTAMRKARGWSQARLAEVAGLNRSTLSYLEAGRSADPDMETVRKLAAALECYDVADLIGVAPAAPPAPSGDVVELLAPADLWAHGNYRKTFTQESLEEMARSIQERGILQPLRARRVDGEHGPLYVIIMGERRWRGARLGIEREWLPADFRLPVILCDIGEKEAALAQLVENLQREEVPPLEEAQRFIELTTGDGAMKVAELAAAIGKTERYVQMRTALVRRGAPEVQAALADGTINIKQARTLIQAPPAEQPKLLKKALENPSWSTQRLHETVTGGHIPCSRAIFDPAAYDGDIYQNPETGQRYFTDKARFLKLQAAAAVAKVEELRLGWAWAEILETGWPQYTLDKYDVGHDPAREGCIVVFDPRSGKVDVHEHLVPRTPPAKDAEAAARRAAENAAYEAREAAASTFRAALVQRLLAEPGLVSRLWLLEELYGDRDAGLFCHSFQRGLPSRLFGKGAALHPLASFVQPYNDADHGRVLVDPDHQQAEVWSLLAARPGVDIRLTVEARLAERLVVYTHRPLHPILLQLARRLGVPVPDALLPDGQRDLEDAINAAATAPEPGSEEADSEGAAVAPACTVRCADPRVPADLLARLAEALPRAPGFGRLSMILADCDSMSERVILLKDCTCDGAPLYDLSSYDDGFGVASVAKCCVDDLTDYIEVWLANPEDWGDAWGEAAEEAAE